MPPRAVPLTLPSLLLFASCAFASGEASPDGGRSDARTRADAALGTPADAADSAPPSMADAASSAPVDASAPVPDATPSFDAEAAPETLLITEIVDADLVGGLPKFVELTNLGSAAVDLSNFSLAVFNNGSLTINSGTSTPLSGTLAPSASFVVSFENSDTPGNSSFRTVYGADGDHLSFGAIISGNDTVALYRGVATGTGADATMVDIYGVVGIDGNGQTWEYTDGFATRRQAATTPSALFAASEWGFSGPGALEGVGAAGIAAATSPGSH